MSFCLYPSISILEISLLASGLRLPCKWMWCEHQVHRFTAPRNLSECQFVPIQSPDIATNATSTIAISAHVVDLDFNSVACNLNLPISHVSSI